MFENKVFNGIYYSRFIASWNRSGDGFNPRRFEAWPRSLGIPEEVMKEIGSMYDNGKMELEDSASNFCEENPILVIEP